MPIVTLQYSIHLQFIIIDPRNFLCKSLGGGLSLEKYITLRVYYSTYFGARWCKITAPSKTLGPSIFNYNSLIILLIALLSDLTYSNYHC